MSRRCALCPTSSMPGHARHLHELRPGDRFRFRGSSDKGILYELISVGPSRCEIAQLGADANERTTFKAQRKGKTALSEPREVSFTRKRKTTTCTGGADVIPELPLEEQLGRSIEECAPAEGGAQVIDLMQVLRESLQR